MTNKEKAEATIEYFKHRNELKRKGDIEAERYLKSKTFQTRNVCVDGRSHEKKRAR